MVREAMLDLLGALEAVWGGGRALPLQPFDFLSVFCCCSSSEQEGEDGAEATFQATITATVVATTTSRSETEMRSGILSTHLRARSTTWYVSEVLKGSYIHSRYFWS